MNHVMVGIITWLVVVISINNSFISKLYYTNNPKCKLLIVPETFDIAL